MTSRVETFPSWGDEIDASELINGEGGQLLQTYTKMKPENIESHVKYIARKGWNVLRYPCFQQFLFLHLDLSRSPLYQEVTKQARSGSLLLDIGCGLGQDLRRLVQDGAPGENLIGLEIQQAYIDLGYEFFQDNSTLECKFLVQDFFKDTPELTALAKKISIMNSGYFMHMFDWKKQLDVAKRMIDLMAPGKGSIITGVNFGSTRSAGPFSDVPPGFDTIFLHNKRSLSGIWSEAAKATDTEWKFDCVLEDDENFKNMASGGCRLRWTVEMQ
ncbi:hypothetical protein N7478_003171 [Penicillium angulare]|uniref:uncharacterized protein n=1 Tax=Penicillium angulare TaxID=116970 RepID=UPI002541BFC2|nr:uncharacterized protein N7478_003171 [Penicillium angulare]KAJ5287485.1 hypothetical protein N7478_003171 [Penicillium angulare]